MKFTRHDVMLALGILLAATIGRGETLRVMSFNIRGAGHGLDPVDSWIWLNVGDPDHLLDGPHRRDRALAVIGAYSPELLGVEELKLDQRNDILNAFPDFAFFGQGRQGGDLDDANGIFYRTERFHLLSGGDFWLSSTPDIPGTTFTGGGSDTHNPRMATWATFRDLSTGQRLFVMNTHWSLDSQARLQSAQLIQSYLPSLSEGLPILMLGDLNATSFSTAYRTLRGLTSTTDVDLLDAFADAGGVDGRTYHDYAGGVSGTRIDHILYSGSPLTPLSAQIVRTTYDGGLFPSDHFPVTVTFDIAVPEIASSLFLLAALISLACLAVARSLNERSKVTAFENQ